MKKATAKKFKTVTKKQLEQVAVEYLAAYEAKKAADKILKERKAVIFAEMDVQGVDKLSAITHIMQRKISERETIDGDAVRELLGDDTPTKTTTVTNLIVL